MQEDKVADSTFDERELIRRVVERDDHEAYRALYRRYSAEILRRLHRLMGRADQAEDTLQRVFLEAYRSLPGFRGESQFRTWLHRIAERVAMAQMRKEWRSRSLFERWNVQAAEQAPAPAAGPDQQLAQRDLQAWMQQFIERLAPKKRLVLLLCDLEGQTYEQVAKSQGTSEGTIASRLHHARKDLRKMIEHALKKQGMRYEDLFDEG